MIIYWTDLSEIPHHLLSSYQQKLSDLDLKRYHCITDQLRKYQFLMGRTLIYRFCQEHPRLEKSGKPIISNHFISLSHCRQIVVLAVSDFPVGIDIENKNKQVSYQKLAHRLNFELTQDEAVSFYQNFTQYEADFKCGPNQDLYHHFFYLKSDYIGCISYPDRDAKIEFKKVIPYL